MSEAYHDATTCGGCRHAIQNDSRVPDVLMLCPQCVRFRLRLLQGVWYCFGCGNKVKEPTLVYDLRR